MEQSISVQTLVGEGAFRYEARVDWVQRPRGFSWQEVAAVACDSRDRLYVFNRGEHPVMVFHQDGSFLQAWGEGLFARRITRHPEAA